MFQMCLRPRTMWKRPGRFFIYFWSTSVQRLWPHAWPLHALLGVTKLQRLAVFLCCFFFSVRGQKGRTLPEQWPEELASQTPPARSIKLMQPKWCKSPHKNSLSLIPVWTSAKLQIWLGLTAAASQCPDSYALMLTACVVNDSQLLTELERHFVG